MAYIGNQVSSITTAAQVTNTTTNTENKSVFLAFVDTQGVTTTLETDSDLAYNPSTNLLTTAGNVDASHVNVTNSVQATAGNFAGNVAASHVNVTNTLHANTATFSANVTASYFVGTATEAIYADLAEEYVADDTYEPGTVLVFGGSTEVTTTNKTHDTRVAGVVSTNPAYLMNKDSGNTSLGLTGRLPCLVKGPVDKGTLLVTSTTPGVAQALNDAYYKPGCVIGKSMNTLTDSSIELIEIAVGRF